MLSGSLRAKKKAREIVKEIKADVKGKGVSVPNGTKPINLGGGPPKQAPFAISQPRPA